MFLDNCNFAKDLLQEEISVGNMNRLGMWVALLVALAVFRASACIQVDNAAPEQAGKMLNVGEKSSQPSMCSGGNVLCRPAESWEMSQSSIHPSLRTKGYWLQQSQHESCFPVHVVTMTGSCDNHLQQFCDPDKLPSHSCQDITHCGDLPNLNRQDIVEADDSMDSVIKYYRRRRGHGGYGGYRGHRRRHWYRYYYKKYPQPSPGPGYDVSHKLEEALSRLARTDKSLLGGAACQKCIVFRESCQPQRDICRCGKAT